MITEGRIAMNEEEAHAVEQLLNKHDARSRGPRVEGMTDEEWLAAKPTANAHLTRRDPGESGPIVVEIEGVGWEIDAKGKTKKVTPEA